ncbi:glycosyltransferase [bacterium]|nr:glycosyltransferase [bacterium]
MIRLAKNRSRSSASLRIVLPTPLYGGSLPIAYHAADAFRKLGHTVELMALDNHYALYALCGEEARDTATRRSLQGAVATLLAELAVVTAVNRKADLVWYTAQSPVTAASLRKLREAGIRTAFWFVEDIQRFNYWEHLASEFDYFFTIQDGEAERVIEASGARVVRYLPSAANPEVHRVVRVTEAERRRFGSRYSFVGAGYPNRVALFDQLDDKDFKIWGNDWPKDWQGKVQEGGRRVTPEETCLIYNSTEVNINLHSSVSGTILERGDFVNPRTFEIAACGAFQIVNTQAPLGRHFELGKELIAVDSIKELRDAMHFYAVHPAARSEIATAGMRRVLAEHTYVHRMSDALTCMGLGSSALSQRISHPTIADLKAVALGDREMLTFLSQFKDESPARLDDLTAKIPAGTRNLTRPELLLLLMREFRRWGIEKQAIE